MSLYLLTLFIEEAIEEMMEETKSVRKNGKRVHGIRFSDDTALVEENENDTSHILNTLSDILNKFQRNEFENGRHKTNNNESSK